MDKIYRRNIYPNHDFDKINRIVKMDLNNLVNLENLNKTCAERRSLSVVEMSRSIKVQDKKTFFDILVYTNLFIG